MGAKKKRGKRKKLHLLVIVRDVGGNVRLGDDQVEDLKTTITKPLNTAHHILLHSANNVQEPKNIIASLSCPVFLIMSYFVL